MWKLGVGSVVLFLLAQNAPSAGNAADFKPVHISWKGKVANQPTLINTADGLYLAWFQWLGDKKNVKSTRYFLAISQFDSVHESFKKPWKALETDVRRSSSSTLVSLSPKLRQKDGTEPSFRIVLDKLDLATEGIGPLFWSGLLEPIAKEEKFKLTLQKEILGHRYFLQPGKGGGIVRLQFLDWKLKEKEGKTYLLGSGGREVWLAPFAKDGSLGGDPKVIYHSLQNSLELRVSGVIAPNDEFFVFIPTGKKSYRFIRSTDGKSWSKPEDVETTGFVEHLSSYVDDTGNIWVCYISHQAKRFSLYLTKSKDMAKTWEKPLSLLGEDKILAEPCIAVSGKYLTIVYRVQDKIFTSTDVQKLAANVPEEWQTLWSDKGQIFGLIIPLADLKFESKKEKGR